MPKPKTLSLLKKTPHAKIFQTDNFKDGLYFIEKYKAIFKKILALFDIDNTVLSYRHTLGTDQWFDFDFNEFMKKGKTADQAKETTLSLYLDFVKKIHAEDVYAVEEDTPEMIRKIQAMGIDALALTSRGSYLLEVTKEQLQRFEIDFNKGTYQGSKKLLSKSPEGIFTNGMILTGGSHKGEGLFESLADFSQCPEFMLMWDDRLSNLEKVQASIEQYNTQKEQEAKTSGTKFTPIKFIGLRYSKLDHLCSALKPEVVALQEKYFNRILSDEHAAIIANAEQKKLRRNYVDIDYQPQKDTVIISICKTDTYAVLKNIEPNIENYHIIGSIKSFNQKAKLAWQFKFTVAEFQELFHKLSQHGLIEPSQFDVLNPIFCKNTVLTFQFEQHVHKSESSDKHVPPVQGKLMQTQSTML
ncbi:MAG: DUF2608 domain-containing protein [Proteobacteria bacterium]|nr:DUF2608 domain-containing protein [Pseudomonadota bacterium]